MNSDSESQDSDDGRRFRFESTRKDTASLATVRRKISPPRRRRYSRSRTRSRSRDGSSRYSKDERRSRPSVDRDSNNKKDKNSKSGSKEKKKHHRDSHRSKDFDKHKSKHRKRSRERSRERNNPNEETSKRKEERPESVTETNERKVERRKDEDISKRKEESIVMNDRKSEKQKDEGNSKRKEVTVPNGQKQKESDKVNEKNAEKTREECIKLVVSDEIRADAAVPVRKRPKSFFERVVNKKAIEEDTSYYGPMLPPQLEKKLLNVREREDVASQTKIADKQSSMEKDESQTIGPSLPPHLFASNQKHDDDNKKETDDTSKKEEEGDVEVEEDSFGPSLPLHLQKRKVVGPMLPANFVPEEIPMVVSSMSSKTEINKDNDNIDDDDDDDNDDNDDDDDDVVGPLPPDHPAARSQAQQLLEYRALQMKARFRDKTSPDKNKREEWMTELPPAHAVALGLGSIPRTFRTTERPDMSDRSMWTDTPADRLRKQREKEENRFIPSQESSTKRKTDNDEAVPKEPKEEKQTESLLDMHLKSLKKKKKKMEKEAKELGLPTRRPFDRDIDLQANRLDDARKKKIFEKASRLNDRFSTAKML